MYSKSTYSITLTPTTAGQLSQLILGLFKIHLLWNTLKAHTIICFCQLINHSVFWLVVCPELVAVTNVLLELISVREGVFSRYVFDDIAIQVRVFYKRK